MKYQIFVIDDYYEKLGDPRITNFMNQLFLIKKTCYEDKHKNNYLSISQDDIFCVHVLVVDSLSETVVMAFKVIKFSSCEKYKVEFPLRGYLKETGKDQGDLQILERFLSPYIQNNDEFTYSGGWVINPEYKGRGLTKELKEIYTGIHYLVHQELKAKAITAIGLANIGTDKFFDEMWGLSPISGVTHRIRSCPGFEIRVISMRLEDAKFYKLQMAKKYLALWNARLELSLDAEDLAKAA